MESNPKRTRTSLKLDLYLGKIINMWDTDYEVKLEPERIESRKHFAQFTSTFVLFSTAAVIMHSSLLNTGLYSGCECMLITDIYFINTYAEDLV